MFGILLLFIHVACRSQRIFLVSRQLVLLSTFPEFVHLFCGKKGCTESRLFHMAELVHSVEYKMCAGYLLQLQKERNFKEKYVFRYGL